MAQTPTMTQRLLKFESDKETKRLERVQRMMSLDPKRITSGAKLFDYSETSRIAGKTKGGRTISNSLLGSYFQSGWIATFLSP